MRELHLPEYALDAVRVHAGETMISYSVSGVVLACALQLLGGLTVDEAAETSLGAPAATSTPGAVSVPFNYAHRGIFVRVKIGGVDAGWFLLDTGAGVTVVDRRLVRKLRLEHAWRDSLQGPAGSTWADLYRLGDTSVGGATVAGLVGIEQDLSVLPSSPGVRVSGILGADFLERFVVHVDFGRQTLMLVHGAQTAFIPVAGHALPITFWMDQGAPRITAMLDCGIAADFRIDTGLSGAYDDGPYVTITSEIWDQLARAHASSMTDANVSARGIGGGMSLPVMRIDVLTVGQNGVTSPRVIRQLPRGYFARPDAAGLIGNSVLERFSPIVIDYAGRKLYLTTQPGARRMRGSAACATRDHFVVAP